jgi:hypothetical protein
VEVGVSESSGEFERQRRTWPSGVYVATNPTGRLSVGHSGPHSICYWIGSPEELRDLAKDMLDAADWGEAAMRVEVVA